MAPKAGLLLVLTSALSLAVDGHSLFTNLYVNNENQGDGTCVRMPLNNEKSTYPVRDLNDNAMVCGFDGTKGVQRVCSVPQGSQLGFQYRTFPDGSQEGSVEPSHKGPCAVYMKAVHSASEASGEGNGWFKVHEEGYDSNAGQWCSDKIIANNGIMSMKLPSDLARGDYLVRTELLALHEADKSPPDPQFYVGCAQIFLDTNGDSGPAPEAVTSIPGYVKESDPSVTFSIYSPRWPYQMAGPPVYTTGIPMQQINSANSAKYALPKNAVAVNGNWVGTEQEAYSTESGCWGASNNCYNQLHTCYDSAPATGSRGCKAYERKCAAIQSGCQSGDYNGPPDQGKILTEGITKNRRSRKTRDLNIRISSKPITGRLRRNA